MLCLRPAIIVTFGLLLTTACGTLPGPAPVDRGEYAQVSLVPSGQAGARLAHPAGIDPASLRQVLAALTYEEQGTLTRTRRSPVFDAQEVDELAPRLAAALGEARPDQRVAFVSLVPGSGPTSGARKSEGTLFIESGGIVNIAFSGIQHLLTVDDDFTRFREISLGDPLRVSRSLISLNTEPEMIQARHQGDGDRYPMWVTLDLDRLSQAPMRAASPREDRTERRPEARSSRAQTAEPGQAAARPMPAPAETDTGSLQPDEVRDRLAFLKSLHDDGLISDGEYEQERQKILRRLD